MSARNYSLRLAANPVDTTDSASVMNMTDLITTWKHGHRMIGGNWQAEGKVMTADKAKNDRFMTPRQMEDFFNSAIGKRMIASYQGKDIWDGLIARIEYTHKGQTFVRSIEELANRVKIVYSRSFPQLLTNGDVEDGIWDAVGTPDTRELSTDWIAKGTQSMHIEGALTHGCEVGDSGSRATVAGGTGYFVSIKLKVVSGTWILTVHQSDDDTIIMGQRETVDTGRQTLQVSISESLIYSGTVIIRLTAGAGGTFECYADGAVLRQIPTRSPTEWYEDSVSIKAYGTREKALLRGEMTEDDATARAKRYLKDYAWPRTTGPPRARSVQRRRAKSEELTITCMGLVWSLSWVYTLLDIEQAADLQVAALLAESQFYAGGQHMITPNATDMLVESDNPTHLWRVLEKITESGETDGTQWQCGGYPGFRFRYLERPTVLNYETKDGILMRYGGAPIEPIEVVPGWVLLSDMPITASPGGAATTDDPRWQLASEVWFVDDGTKQFVDVVYEAL